MHGSIHCQSAWWAGASPARGPHSGGGRLPVGPSWSASTAAADRCSACRARVSCSVPGSITSTAASCDRAGAAGASPRRGIFGQEYSPRPLTAGSPVTALRPAASPPGMMAARPLSAAPAAALAAAAVAACQPEATPPLRCPKRCSGFVAHHLATALTAVQPDDQVGAALHGTTCISCLAQSSCSRRTTETVRSAE